VSDAETPAWVEEYYQRSKPRLLKRLRVLRARELEDDLLQSAFMKLLVRARKGLPAFENDALADSYIFATCKNEYISAMRGPRGLTHAAATDVIEPHLQAEASAEESYMDLLRVMSERHEAERLLGNLPVEHRHHMELWSSGDFTPSEIATLMGKTGGAERTQRHRLLKRLRGMVDREREAGK
jgi:RNA polymerase sigma factor (sigma-70 family)